MVTPSTERSKLACTTVASTVGNSLEHSSTQTLTEVSRSFVVCRVLLLCRWTLSLYVAVFCFAVLSHFVQWNRVRTVTDVTLTEVSRWLVLAISCTLILSDLRQCGNALQHLSTRSSAHASAPSAASLRLKLGPSQWHSASSASVVLAALVFFPTWW